MFGGSTRRESIFGKSAYIHGWITDADAIDDLASPVEETEPSPVFSATQNERSLSWTEDTASAGRGTDVMSSTLGGEETGVEVDEPYSDDEFAIEAAQYAILDGRTAFEKNDYAEASKSLQEALKMVRELPSRRQAIYDACDIRYMLGVCCFHLQGPSETREALFAIVHNTPRAKVQDDKRRQQVLNAGHLLAQTDVRLNNLELARSICHQTLQGRAKLLSKTHELYYESLALMSRIVELQGHAQRAKIFAKMLPEDQKSLLEKFSQLAPGNESLAAVTNYNRTDILMQSGGGNPQSQSGTGGTLVEAEVPQRSTDMPITTTEQDLYSDRQMNISADHEPAESHPTTVSMPVSEQRSLEIVSKEDMSSRFLYDSERMKTPAVQSPTAPVSASARENLDLTGIRSRTLALGAGRGADANHDQEIVQRLDLARSTPLLPGLEDAFEPSQHSLELEHTQRSVSHDHIKHATTSAGTACFQEVPDVSYASPALRELAVKTGYTRPGAADVASREKWIASLCKTPYESILEHLSPVKNRDILVRRILQNEKQAAVAANLGRRAVKEGLLMKAGHLLNVVNFWESPLHLACLYGDDEVVESLIIAKARLNTVCKPGLTALHCATMGGHYNAAKLLVDAGCSLEGFHETYRTPMRWALVGERFDMIDLLHRSGVQYNSVHIQAACLTGNVDLVKALLPGDMLKSTNYTPGWFEWARTLITNKDKEPRRTEFGIPNPEAHSVGSYMMLSCDHATMLFTAAHMGCERMVKHLLSIGSDPKLKSKVRFSVKNPAFGGGELDRDFSPVQAACLSGHAEVVRILLESGASTQEVSEDCKIVLGKRWDGLTVAVGADHSECVVALLDHGVQINVDTLLWIIHYGKVDIMCALVDYGLPLSVAATALKTILSPKNTLSPRENSQRKEMCLRLLTLGVEGVASYNWVPDSISTDDGTLLHFMKADGPLFAKLFIESGADIEARNVKGETPLMLAAKSGYHLVVEVLLANGASQYAQNNEGRSAVQYALDNGNREVIERFLRPVRDAA